MDGKRRHRLRLTAAGWVITAALVALVVLTIVSPSPGVFAGLAVVLMIWALLLGSNYPSIVGRGESRRALGEEDFGREAAEEYERKYGHPF